MTLENIKMIRDQFGGTEVIDGAGLIPHGYWDRDMMPQQIIEMLKKRNSIEYQLTNKVRDLIEKIKYQ